MLGFFFGLLYMPFKIQVKHLLNKCNIPHSESIKNEKRIKQDNKALNLKQPNALLDREHHISLSTENWKINVVAPKSTDSYKS